MELSNNFAVSIRAALKELIDAKSKRDNIKFTSYQLANALSMPRSIITKLTHSDPTKRVMNPRIDTLLKIIEFFKADGFPITLDNLLGLSSRKIEVGSQKNTSRKQFRSLPLYSLNKYSRKTIGTVDIALSHSSKNIVAFYLDENAEPLFKAGSLFIVDFDAKPTHDSLIAIQLDSSNRVHIKKYCIQHGKVILKSLDHKNKDKALMPTDTCKILGVVVQVNAKT